MGCVLRSREVLPWIEKAVLEEEEKEEVRMSDEKLRNKRMEVEKRVKKDVEK